MVALDLDSVTRCRACQLTVDPQPYPIRTLTFEQVLPEAILTGGKSGTRSAHAKGGGRPHSAPLDALFDVDRLLAWWTSVDAVLHRVRRAGDEKYHNISKAKLFWSPGKSV